jgi:hypothetical protein
LSITSAVLVACVDKAEPLIGTAVPKVSYTSPNNFNQRLLPVVQSFSIDASKAMTITTSSGSSFEFETACFYNTSGYINSGTVDVKITEVSETSEMMATGAGTESNLGLLASAGMFKIEASQNGKELSLDPNRSIKVQIPANEGATVDGFKIFKGTENPSKDRIIWYESPDTNSLNGVRLEKLGQKYLFNFGLTFLSWCNLDRYANAGGGEPIVVAIDGDDYGNFNTNIYISFELSGGGPKGMVQLFSDATLKQWNTANYNLPFNDKFTIIATAVNLDTKQLEYGIMEITHTPDKIHTFTKLTPISEANLEAKFRALK